MRHISDHHVSQRGTNFQQSTNIYPFKEITAFKGYIRSYRDRSDVEYNSVEHYFKLNVRAIKQIFKNVFKHHQSVKSQVSLAVIFIRGETGLDYEEINVIENSKLKKLHSMHDFKSFVEDVKSDITTVIETFERYGSGWQLKAVTGCDIRVGILPTLTGACHANLPSNIKLKKCIVNVNNKDNKCFMYAFLSIVHYDEIKSHRYNHKKYIPFATKYDFSNVSFPASVDDVMQFNSTIEDKKINVNVFGLTDDHHPHIIKLGKNVKEKSFRQINVLLFDDPSSNNRHFAGIANISRLFGKAQKRKKEFCYNCANLIPSISFKKHEAVCRNFQSQNVGVPADKKTFLEFNSYAKLFPHEFVIYADFESLCKKVYDTEGQKSSKLAMHVPSGYAYVIVQNGKKVKTRQYTGTNVVFDFFKNIESDVKSIKDKYNEYQKMYTLTEEEELQHFLSRTCRICDKEILSTKDKVADHDWVTGQYRGACHATCNAMYTLKKAKIPIVLHNFRSYDSHLIIEGFKYFGKKISVIPSNMEKYISIICDSFVFLDSLMFMNSSLSTLVSDLKDDALTSGKDELENFPILTSAFGNEKGRIFCRKGVYCYDYVDSLKKLEETTLPPKKMFFNRLTNEHITKQDYKFAKSVFSKYCNSLQNFHDLYLLSDALLLADCFENFRRHSIKNFDLDPLHYFTLSGYSWDCALRFSKVKLQVLSDLSMYNFFEAGIRGGLSMISTRYAKANNKHIPGFNKNKPSTYLCYLDKVNLYGECLMQKLPVRDFKWLSKSEISTITAEDILAWDPEGSTGYTLMVDLKYPIRFHNSHSDLPLAPEKVSITYNMLSPYQKKVLKEQGMKYNVNYKKLIPHLGDRTKYIIHYRDLQFYLKMGLELKKIHSGVSFYQEAFFKDYVLLCGKLRKHASTKFETNLFKSMVNHIFGKSIENVRNRRRIEIVNSQERAQKLLTSTMLQRFEIIDSNLVIFELRYPRIVLNKPVYVGFTVLDLAKLFVYEFHYSFKELVNCMLLFTDTDSLAYVVETPDIFSEFKKIKRKMDFSQYPKDHFLFSNKNKRKIGKMKDEGNGKIFTEFVGLAPKMYSFAGINLRKVAAKGIQKRVIEKSLRHRKFVKCLKTKKSKGISMTFIRSYGHRLYTVRQKKVGLRCFDSKRYILKNGINTLAFNHFLLNQ